MKQFLHDLVSDSEGKAGEAQTSFVASQVLILVGMIYNTIVTKHFDVMYFTAGQAALISLYNISIKK